MSSTGPISIRLVVCVASVSNQVISEFTQRDGRKKRTAKHLCVTKVTGLLPETHKGFCYYLGVLSSHNINVSWSFTKDLFKGRCSLAKSFFKQNYCHACHTRVSVFFPLPSCGVTSLLCESWNKSKRNWRWNSRGNACYARYQIGIFLTRKTWRRWGRVCGTEVLIHSSSLVSYAAVVTQTRQLTAVWLRILPHP